LFQVSDKSPAADKVATVMMETHPPQYKTTTVDHTLAGRPMQCSKQHRGASTTDAVTEAAPPLRWKRAQIKPARDFYSILCCMQLKETSVCVLKFIWRRES